MIDKISINLIEGLKMKIDALEKLSHEPQNYKEKCDEMEKRLVRLEVLTKVNTVIDVEERLSKLENIIITNIIDEEES